MHVALRGLPCKALSLRVSSRWSACGRKSQVQASKNTSAPQPPAANEDPEEVTKKWGLEAGLFKSFKNGDGGVSAKDLLQKYGTAYLLTSITLALISFTACYLAVDAGVDISSLLSGFGFDVQADSAVAKGSKVALAYTAHKALSPVRFPPTVALTPLVANKIGKNKDQPSQSAEETDQKQ